MRHAPGRSEGEKRRPADGRDPCDSLPPVLADRHRSLHLISGGGPDANPRRHNGCVPARRNYARAAVSALGQETNEQEILPAEGSTTTEIYCANA